MERMTRQYSATASHARDAVEKTADVWTEGARTVTDRLSGLPQFDLVSAVDRYFDFVQRMVDFNRRLAVTWAEAAGALSGVIREKAESAGEVVRETAETAGDIAREQAAKAERAAREQAAKAEQAEKELARQAREAEREQAEKAAQAAREQAAKAEQAEKDLARQTREAERERTRQAHQRARQRYESLPKAQLSDLLAKRNLPKTGNVDELIERLVEADSK